MAQSRKRRLERLEYDPLDPSKQHQPQTAGELVSSFVDKNLLAGASAASLALTTWRRVAGRRAAKHTVAVWLSEPRGRASLPDLVVYLDGHALMVDLTTNAELYVDRLAHAGLEVGHVRFKLSKKAERYVKTVALRETCLPSRPWSGPMLTPRRLTFRPRFARTRLRRWKCRFAARSSRPRENRKPALRTRESRAAV